MGLKIVKRDKFGRFIKGSVSPRNKESYKKAGAKISIANKGGNRTTFRKGHMSWTKGKNKINYPQLARPQGLKDNLSKLYKEKPLRYWLGKKRSDEDKRKMSKSRLALELKGEKASNWRGGITPENAIIRSSIEYRLWRESVFVRDNYICQKTGIKGGKLIAHHINNFAENIDLRMAIDNGITLSKKAHDEFHKIYGKKNNTRKQMEEYLCN